MRNIVLFISIEYHLIDTNCRGDHSLWVVTVIDYHHHVILEYYIYSGALCCKLGTEFAAYYSAVEKHPGEESKLVIDYTYSDCVHLNPLFPWITSLAYIVR